MPGCIKLLIIASILPCLSACSKVNRQNYEKLELGMEWPQVGELLGEPDHCESVLNAKSCVWRQGERSITVRFIGDRAVLFSSEGL